ncbi:MAG: hypothetical protein L6R42_008242 [Xanthoria sp. 1 TBL-2021]|nr:MAG: hypothetical protein L6R42_008242 [Xanthoria sp. 1 TBL-2021]
MRRKATARPRHPHGIISRITERLQASRALRTATWGAVFYLITTDILGPYTTAWAFSQIGYAPASILYFIFGVLAAYGGALLWRMFLQLDSDRYPLRCYGDIAYRVAGSIARHTVNIVQSVQLLFNVGIIIIQNGQGLSQISKGSVCFIVLCFVWAIAGAVLVNAIALVTTLIAALLYGNIGIKVLYSNVFMDLFGFSSLAQKSGKLLWIAVLPVYWVLAFVVVAAIPSISNLAGLIAAVCILQFSYTFPPVLILFHCAQRDAIQEGVEGFDPSTGQTTRRDSGMSRWMHGLRKNTALNAFNLFFFLGSLATAVLGIYSDVIGLKNACAETAVSGFSCTNPLGA